LGQPEKQPTALKTKPLSVRAAPFAVLPRLWNRSDNASNFQA